jgi:nucleotide-binding universal stress UspA family protein
MFKNILVPLDGSPLAEAALPYAKALAARTGGRLTLVRAAQYASLLGDMAIEQHRSVEIAEDYLERQVERLAAEGYAAQAAVPFGGSTANWIVEEADIRGADLVVMATHDRVGADRWLHGSVAETVVHRSSIPVMVVRAGDAEQLAGRFAEQQPPLVVPLDGSELAEAALPIARGLVDSLGGRLVLVGVIPAPGQFIAGQGGAITTYTDPDLADLHAEVHTYLEGIARRVGAGMQMEIAIGEGDAATQIAQVAQEYMAAAVVMATHGRTGAIRSILGSVAGNVVHRSSGPVLLVRARPVQVAEPVPVQQTAALPVS